MKSRPSIPRRAEGRIRLPALLLGVLLVPASQYWISSTWSGVSILSLFINAISGAFLLSLTSHVLSKVHPRLALRPSELFLTYTMLAAATGAAGHDTLEMLTQVLGYTTQYASPENEWNELFGRYLPHWLLMEDKDVVEGLYRNGAMFFEPKILQAWARPIFWWSVFLSALYLGMVCLNLLFSRQWSERERLAFPVAQIPLGLMNRETFGTHGHLFWTGFLASAGLSLMNGLHQLYPSVPGLTYGRFDLGAFFKDAPWNAIGDVFVEFLPFVMGLGFFIPVTLSFSIWFFYWFWKFVYVFGRIVGLHYLPGFPGFWSQGMGGMMLLATLFLYWSRHHLADVWRTVFHSKPPRDADDDTPYRFAVWGLGFSVLFLLGFLKVAGMAVWVGILFLGGYYALSTVTTRLRAQLGPPTHELPFTMSALLTSAFGVKRIDPGSLAQFAVFRFVDFGQRGSPMPAVMESLYLKDRLRVRQAGLVVTGIVLALVLGTVVGFVGNLQRGYRDTVQQWVGDWAFPELAGWLQNRTEGMNFVYLVYFFIGAGMVFGLSVLSRAFVWWPLHPLGYIMGGEWMLRYLWFPIFLAWVVRWTLLKFGGLNAHRKAIPIFMGVTLGDGVMLALWSLYGTLFRQWTISFVYW